MSSTKTNQPLLALLVCLATLLYSAPNSSFAVDLAQDAPIGQPYDGEVANPPHGIAMHGQPLLPPDYNHFGYVNPDAPKGGRITYGFHGAFDSMNQFIVRGTAPRGLLDAVLGQNVYEGLMKRNRDEAFTMYGLIADTIKTDAERTFLEVTIHPDAKFSDGEPVKVDDLLFTIDLFRAKGRPPYSRWMQAIESVERIGERGVRMNLGEGKNRELPLLLGIIPILPKHAIDFDTFDQSSLTPVLGSGPYVVEDVTPGTRVLLKRNPNYWAKDLPIRTGFDNFDEIVIDYYRNESSRFEAFRKGLFDTNPESNPARWSGDYNFPAVKSGDIVLDTYETATPSGMQGMIFNTRQEKFSDKRIREAFTYLFDFEWVNENLYSGAYNRTASLFHNSELSSFQRPADDAEKRLLKSNISKVEPSVLDGTYSPPISDGTGGDRKNLRKAVQLFREAGYTLKDGKMVDAKSGEPFTFEFMSKAQPEERLALALQRNVSRIGVEMTIRTVDSAQYWERWKRFDFDMLIHLYTASLSPGSEQYGRWGQVAAETDGSLNLAGASDPAIDDAIDALVAARDRDEFVTAVRAFDRLVVSGTYFIPLFHTPGQWLARRTRIAVPEKTSTYGYQPATWWAVQ
ncbi:MAG: extracellular solute-binding protein [Hyphomicrobiales bacterium]